MKIGIIGNGRRMSAMLKQFQEIAPELTAVGIIDAGPEGARSRLREEDSLDDLIRETKPDALAIGTQCDTHTQHAIEAAKYDLPLFLEKPVSINMEQATALEKAFENTRCSALVSFPLRVSSVCRRAKHLLDQGAVGRIDHLLAVNYVKYGNVYFDTWHRDYAVTQGLFLQKATHDFDYLTYLVGAPVTRVAAMSSHGRVYRDTKTLVGTPDPNAIYLDHVGTPAEGMNEDSSSALLEFANGAHGVYTQVFFSRRLGRRGVTLSGYRGALDFDWYEGKIVTTHHREPLTETCELDGSESHFGGDRVLSENFIEMIRSGAAPLAPIEAGLESVYACLAAKESADTGRFVNVRQLGAC
jgi:predicted dehydrogenase